MEKIINRYDLITRFVSDYPEEQQQEAREMIANHFSDEELAHESGLIVLRKGFFVGR